MTTRPTNRNRLWGATKELLGLRIPRVRVCPHHAAPFDYFADAFFGETGNCVVWANRGGGKTMLAAALTVMESLYEGKMDTRILGGSLAQSSYMFDYIRRFTEHSRMQPEPKRATARRMRLTNGARIDILTQSFRSVRGVHPPRVRLDELDEFKRDVFQAALFLAQTTDGIGARTEMLSTMHRPYGIMSDVMDTSRERDLTAYKWCLWEVIERCRDRSCSRCVLNSCCGGKAKRARGYYKIDDAIAIRRLVSDESWDSEMLCLRPSREGLFYKQYDESLHVASEPLSFDACRETYRAFDWGVNGPTVCLWIQVDGDGRVYVIDEMYQSGIAVSDMAENVLIYEKAIGCGDVLRSYGDPSGASFMKEFEKRGIRCQGRREDGGRLNVRFEGFETVRRFLKPDEQGRAKLLISPRCVNTRREFRTYHYPQTPEGCHPFEEPAKVEDHAMDAIRYFFTSRFMRDGWGFA